VMRVSSFCAAAVLILGAFQPAATAEADEPWDGPALTAPPAVMLRAAAAGPAPENADIEMLLEEVCYEFDQQGRQCSTVRRVYRCLTEHGVESGAWSVGEWSPWHEERPSMRARVITPDGAVHLLDPKTIAEVPARSSSDDVLTDRRALRVPLPAVKVGAVVEEEIVVRQMRPFFGHGLVREQALIRFYPTRKLRVTIEAPVELPLRYEVRASDTKPVRSERGGKVRLSFEVRPPVKFVFPEPYLPPELPAWPSVSFSTGKSWADVAAGYAALVEPQIDLESVKSLVKETIGAETDRRGVATKLLARLQGSVRYVAIEFGQAAIVPAKPQDTLTRRYGDCKDQSALLVAMLRAAGQPAYLALLNSGYGSELVPGLPGLGRFNHAVVYMPGKEPLWIDPTVRDVPLGQLSHEDQGRLALVAASDTKALIRTPRGDYRQHSVVDTHEYFLVGGGQDRVRTSSITTGAFAQAQRAWYDAIGREKMAEYWKAEMKRSYQSQSLTRFAYSSKPDVSRSFEVQVEAVEANVAQSKEDEVLLTLAPSSVFQDLPWLFTFAGNLKAGRTETDMPDGTPGEKPGVGAGSKPENPTGKSVDSTESWKVRKSPLALHMPHVRQVRYRISPPPGFRVRELPKDEAKRYGPATFSQQYAVKDGGLIGIMPICWNIIRRAGGMAPKRGWRKRLRNTVGPANSAERPRPRANSIAASPCFCFEPANSPKSRSWQRRKGQCGSHRLCWRRSLPSVVQTRLSRRRSSLAWEPMNAVRHLSRR